MRFVDNPGVLEKFRQRGIQPRVKLHRKPSSGYQKGEGSKEGQVRSVQLRGTTNYAL